MATPPTRQVNIESIGFKEQSRRQLIYYILIRFSESGVSFQFSYDVYIKRLFFKKGYKVSRVIPIAIPPTQFQSDIHSLITEALSHLTSDLNTWKL